MRITEITMGDVEQIFQTNCSRIVRQIRAAATTGDDDTEWRPQRRQPAPKQATKPDRKAKGSSKKRKRGGKKPAGPKPVPLKRAPMPKPDPPDKTAANNDDKPQQPKQPERPKLHFGMTRSPHPATQLGPYAHQRTKSTPSPDHSRQDEPK